MSIREYIESGVLEIYVLGLTDANERAEVEKMAAAHPEIRKEIAEISAALENYAETRGVAPHPAIKPLLYATIDYTERLENGEAPSFPPILNENSSPADYKEWLDRSDMTAPADFEEIFAKIIGFTPEVTSAIVWIKNMAPQEVHADEYEKFLILEGSCDITIGTTVHSLVPGNYLSIPLHIDHHVRITSSTPCKVLLQRVAA